MGELASLTHLNSVKFHTGTDELASLTLFNSVKFRGHLRRFLILYGLKGILNVFDSLAGMCQDGRPIIISLSLIFWL